MHVSHKNVSLVKQAVQELKTIHVDTFFDSAYVYWLDLQQLDGLFHEV